MKALCLTEDAKLFRIVREEGERLFWNILGAADQAEFMRQLENYRPDAILADINDSRIFEWWRGRPPSGCPIVFISNRPAELRASLERLERMRGRRHFPEFGLFIDGERQTARLGSQPLELTLTELRLLRELAGVSSDAVARKVLEGCIFGAVGRRRCSLDVHICSLRKKLKAVGLVIEAVRGVGYRLNPCRNSA
jgi:DNA-binding response OmpR family regulator